MKVTKMKYNALYTDAPDNRNFSAHVRLMVLQLMASYGLPPICNMAAVKCVRRDNSDTFDSSYLISMDVCTFSKQLSSGTTLK